MASTHVKIPIGPLMRRATICVDVTGVRTWRLRLWVGMRLIALAAIVMGCGIRFDRPAPDHGSHRTGGSS